MLTRILTGLVGVPIIVWLLHSGGMLFNAAIFVLAAIGWLEFYNMAKNKGYNVFYFSSGIMTLVLVGSLMYLDDSIYTLYSLPLFLVVFYWKACISTVKVIWLRMLVYRLWRFYISAFCFFTLAF